MPAQTSGLGAAPPSRTPVAAAATGAMPVGRPARLAPSRRTLEYHKTKAAIPDSHGHSHSHSAPRGRRAGGR